MTNSCRASLWLSACLVLVACGGPGADNAAPTVGAVEDQTVLRNTSNPRSVSVELSIADPDDEAFTVSVDSEDEQTLQDTTFGCGPGACTLVLTPSAAKTADVNVNVTVSDGSGGQATTGFVIHVVPLLVTTAADDGPGSLRQTILDSEPGDVIGFDVAGEFASPMNIALTTQITLDSDLTIEGAGRNPFNVVIEAAVQEGSVRLFEVAGGATVVLRDLQLRGGAVQDPGVGGTVLVNEGGGLSLVGCLLQDSFARLGGFVYNAGGEVVLDDTIVEGTLSHPTREHNAAEGGAIFNAGGTVSVRNGSRISYSRTTGDGGAVSQIGSTAVTAIDDSEVLENTAGTGFGGGIHLVEGALSISGSVFVGNSVEDGIGGAIALRPPTVMAVAPGDPGTGSGPSDGPAPSLETETLTIEETTVRGNSAPDCGGIAILGDFSARIEDSVIGDPDLGDEEDDGNFTSGRGGGLCRTIDQGVAVLINTVVAGNQAQRGGGIFLSGGSLELSDGSRVRGNSAEEGGGIYVDPDPDDDPTTLSLVNSVVGGGGEAEGNAATMVGGGIYHGIGDLAVTAGSRVQGNSAGGAGGGIFVNGEIGSVTIDGSSIGGIGASLGNVAGTEGGGIFQVAGALTIGNGSLIAGNKAHAGGGLYLFGKATDLTANIEDSTIGGSETGAGNAAILDGGGIYVDGGGLPNRGGLTLTDSVIAGNDGDADDDGNGSGGGVYTVGAVLIVLDTEVSGNSATLGGGVYNDSAGALTLGTGTAVTSNTATHGVPGASGGGVYSVGDIVSNEGDVSGNDPDDIVEP